MYVAEKSELKKVRNEKECYEKSLEV